MKFRFHKGGYQESMDTLKEVHSMEELRDYIQSVYTDSPLGDIQFHHYGYDERNNWGTTWLVMRVTDVGSFPIGMSDATSFD